MLGTATAWRPSCGGSRLMIPSREVPARRDRGCGHRGGPRLSCERPPPPPPPHQPAGARLRRSEKTNPWSPQSASAQPEGRVRRCGRRMPRGRACASWHTRGCRCASAALAWARPALTARRARSETHGARTAATTRVEASGSRARSGSRRRCRWRRRRTRSRRRGARCATARCARVRPSSRATRAGTSCRTSSWACRTRWPRRSRRSAGR